MGAMKDPRVLRGLSLILLELLTAVPTATFTDILGEFIPFSIGALAVLGQFCLGYSPRIQYINMLIPCSRIQSPRPRGRRIAHRYHAIQHR